MCSIRMCFVKKQISLPHQSLADLPHRKVGTHVIAADLAYRSHHRLGNFAAAACAVLLLQVYSVRAEPVTLEEVAAFPSHQG